MVEEAVQVEVREDVRGVAGRSGEILLHDKVLLLLGRVRGAVLDHDRAQDLDQNRRQHRGRLRGQARSGELRRAQRKSGEVRRDRARFGEIGRGSARSGEVGRGRARSEEVRRGWGAGRCSEIKWPARQS